jgi:hypothetical protein
MVLVMIQGCEFGESLEKQHYDFEVTAVVRQLNPGSSMEGDVIPGASVQFSAYKEYVEGGKDPGSELSGSKKTNEVGICTWSFGYNLKYDPDNPDRTESVVVKVYADKDGISGEDYLKMGPYNTIQNSYIYLDLKRD